LSFVISIYKFGWPNLKGEVISVMKMYHLAGLYVQIEDCRGNRYYEFFPEPGTS